MPGAANGDQSFVGSVIAVQGDRTTISMAFDGEGIETEYYGQGPKTVTVGGTTYVAYEVSATAIVEDVSATATIDLACSRADDSAVPTCEINTKISGGPPDETSGLSDATATTTTMSGDMQYYLNNFPLVITAGEEKLGASAAATPSASEATPTGTTGSSARLSGTSGASALSGAPTASGASAAASAASSAASSAVAQATGAAASMRSFAPVMVGMGAVAAFFV